MNIAQRKLPLINYQTLVRAKQFYASCGYTEIAVPWIIGYEAYSATKPPDRKEFYTIDGYLNASGEQSFLELLLNGEQLRKHLCITPCFREEPVRDELHQQYFLKVELINTEATIENLQVMLSDAKKFFDTCLPLGSIAKIIPTDKVGMTFDIVDSIFGIELGSYGVRTYKQHTWIYGTGVAIPRIDIVIQKINDAAHPLS